MTKTNQDFLMWSGDTKTITVTVYDADGNTVNITGVTITWQLSQNVDSAALLTKTVGSGITLSSPVVGEFEIALVAADTAGLSGRYYHEAEITDGSNNISTAMIGHVTINTDAI